MTAADKLYEAMVYPQATKTAAAVEAKIAADAASLFDGLDPAVMLDHLLEKNQLLRSVLDNTKVDQEAAQWALDQAEEEVQSLRAEVERLKQQVRDATKKRIGEFNPLW